MRTYRIILLACAWSSVFMAAFADSYGHKDTAILNMLLAIFLLLHIVPTWIAKGK